MREVCVIGLGQVGLPTALYVMKRGLKLCGYDIDSSKATAARNQGIDATDSWESIGTSDVYIICVGTGWKADRPDFSSLQEVAGRIEACALRRILVSVESTVMPGTCRSIFGGDSKKRMLIHVPHRYWDGDPTHYGVNQKRVIGALDESSLGAGLELYEKTLGIPLYRAVSLEIAETSKITENAYRFVQIAFAEEVRIICEENGIDFRNIREACNTKWNINIPEARDGIGGHCLPKDIRYLASLSGRSATLLSAAIAADESYKRRELGVHAPPAQWSE